MKLIRARTAVLILVVGLALAAATFTVSRLRSAPVAAVRAPAAESLQAAALSTVLPSDPAVRTGRLANGFSYYVRANRQPLGRAELRLVVNAGSVLEADDQRGFAHFVEHMAFNGTTRFPKQAIASFLQSVGMRFGPSVNATTGFDETTYALQIPTDRPEILARAITILEDWAHNVTFDPGEVDRERGVVIEEWRQRRGASQRLQGVTSAAIFKDSRYAGREPIGTLESLQTFDARRLAAFYADWYRPDLMALVAVGDFDPRAVETLVRTQFAPLQGPAQPRPRPVFDVPVQAGVQYVVAADTEAAGASIAVAATRKPHSQATVGDYRREIVERLTAGLFSARLAEAAERPGAPLLGAGAARTRVLRSQDIVTFSGALRPEAIDKGAAALLLELERIGRFGFTAEELDRQKAGTMRGFERAILEKENRPSAVLAAEYIRHFTRAEPFPGLEYEFDLTKRFLPDITLDDVNAVAAGWLSDEGRVIAVTGPDKPGVTLPTREWLSQAMRTAKTTPVARYVPRAGARPLLSETPASGTVTETTVRGAIGITEWTLSNGARVLLKPTDFKQDEVVFTAFSPGGTSLAPDAAFVPAQTAADVVSALGVGTFASADLRRALTGKIASVRPVIGPYEEGLAGAASRRDLETLFQLVYLNFTQPRRDPAIFAALTSQMRSGLATRTSTPDFAFGAAVARALTQDHPRGRPLTGEAVAAMNLDQSLAFYRDRFADASDFTFVFVGSFDVEAMRPLVERYIASLPSLRRAEHWRDVGIRPAAGIVNERVERGIEPKSRTAIVFTGPFAPEPSRGLALRAAAEVLQTRLREILREELGGAYTVTVGATVARIPRNEYTVTVMFGSDPARTDALAARVLTEAGRLAAEGPGAGEAANVKAALSREFETSSRQNAFLLMQIAERCRTGEPPETLLEVPKTIASLDAGSIRAAARAAFDPARYIRVTLVPER